MHLKRLIQKVGIQKRQLPNLMLASGVHSPWQATFWTLHMQGKYRIVCCHMWGRGARKGERGREREREVLAIQELNGRQKGGWGRELPTTVWRHFQTPSCFWADNLVFPIQCVWDGPVWLGKIYCILLNPATRWSFSFFIDKDLLPSTKGM